MKEPKHKYEIDTAVRQRAKQSGRKRFPAGRALGRIQYFEAKRALSRTIFSDGIVCQESEAKPRMLKRKPRKAAAVSASPYLSALRTKQQNALAFIDSGHLPVWQPAGPELIPHGQTYGTGGNNDPAVSGRCVGVMVSSLNPMHLVVCAANGGLWGSFDRGESWAPLTDNQPTVSMGAIAVAPGSPNIVYAGTGEGDTFSQLGVGLLRSNDGGLVWDLVPADELAGFGIYDIAIDPDDPFHLWVGTTQRLLESKDGGDSWQVIQRLRTWSISIHPDNPDEIYAATNAGIIVSQNGGQNWALVSLNGVASGTDFERLEVSHAPSKPAVVYVAGAISNPLSAGMWRKSTTNGNFVVQRAAPLQSNSDLRQSWYDWCFGVAPDDHDEVYWGAVHLYKGKRGASGFRWSNISSRSSGDSIHPDQHHIGFDPLDSDVVYICNDGGLFRSPDRGTSWESLNPGLNITEFEYITHLESDPNWLMGGTQDNGTLAYKQGLEWDQVALGDGGDCGTDEANDKCYHSYFGMWIERADTHGSSAFQWRDVSPPFNPNTYSALFYPPLEVHNHVVAKAGTTLFVSNDRGIHWIEIDFGNGIDKASSLSIPDDQTIYLGTTEGGFFRFQKGGIGWSDASVLQLASPVGAYLSDIFVPGGSNTSIWVSSSAFGGAHVFHSIDGGVSWTDRTGDLPDIPVNALVGDPEDTSRLFVATDHGVYETTNGGANWRDFSLGLPNVLIGDLLFHQNSRILRAGTRSRGVWEIFL